MADVICLYQIGHITKSVSVCVLTKTGTFNIELHTIYDSFSFCVSDLCSDLHAGVRLLICVCDL